MNAMASPIIGVSIVYSIVCSGTNQRKYQSSTLLAFVRGIHRWPVDSPHKEPVTRKMFPFGDVIKGLCVPVELEVTLTFQVTHVHAILNFRHSIVLGKQKLYLHFLSLLTYYICVCIEWYSEIVKFYETFSSYLEMIASLFKVILLSSCNAQNLQIVL